MVRADDGAVICVEGEVKAEDGDEDEDEDETAADGD